MRHSLHSHIIYLEEKIQSLTDRLTEPHLTDDETQGLKAQIFHAIHALEHYRQAYALELSVSTPEPPQGPATNSNGGSHSPGNSKSENKKGDLAGAAARVRKKARAAYSPGIAAFNRARLRFR